MRAAVNLLKTGSWIMNEYKLSQEFFTQMQKRLVIFVVPLMILAVVVGFWTSASWIEREGDKSYFTSPIFFLVIVLIVVVFIYSLRRSLRQQRQLWSSYRLIMDEYSIKRTREGLPDIIINYNEISKITEAPEFWLIVHTSIPSRRISVPATLEDYAEFRLELSKRYTIDITARSRTNWSQLIFISYGLLTLAALAITFLATNRYVVIVIGTLLFVAQLLGFVIIQRSINSSKQLKRSSWFTLPVLVIIAARVFFAISSR